MFYAQRDLMRSVYVRGQWRSIGTVTSIRVRHIRAAVFASLVPARRVPGSRFDVNKYCIGLS
jgi:hypothetical protein